MTYCRRCKTDGVLYGEWPHQVKCPYTGELHYRGEKCNVEFAPVKHGKWLREVDLHPELYGWVPLSSVVCSVCKTSNGLKQHYCPNCGAKMDLKD